MLEAGYYKSYLGTYHYLICEAIQTKENNTQERWVVHKEVESDTIYIMMRTEFEGFIETEDGGKLKRFKKLDNHTPLIPPKPIPYSPYTYPHGPYICPPAPYMPPDDKTFPMLHAMGVESITVTT